MTEESTSAATQPSSWPPSTDTPPAELRTAFGLWVANIVISIVIAAVSYAVKQRIPGVSFTLNGKPATGIGLVVFAIIVFAIGYGLIVFFLVKMRGGRNWARIVLTVLGVLGSLANLATLLSGNGFAIVSALVSLILVPGAIVQMYRPAANQFINAR